MIYGGSSGGGVPVRQILWQGQPAKYVVKGQTRELIWAPEWVLRTRYEPGDIVQYDGRFYKWIAPISGLGFTPGLSATRWEEITNVDS